MNRIREIKQNLERLSEMDEQLDNCEEWNIVAHDIIQKLDTVRKECERCASTSNLLLLTPPSSTSSTSLHSDNSSYLADNGSIYSDAIEAFEQQIFSRCVRLVESANRDSPVDMYLISLAHHSYAEMVMNSACTDNALKLARWWAEFLDSAEAGRGHSEKIDLLDYETVACQRIVDLGILISGRAERDDVQRLLEVVVRSYEMVTLLNRPFHVLSMQRLLRLGSVLDTIRESQNGQFVRENVIIFKLRNNNHFVAWKAYYLPSVLEAENVMINAIQNVIRDRKKMMTSSKIRENDTRLAEEYLSKIMELQISAPILEKFPEFELSNNIVLRM